MKRFRLDIVGKTEDHPRLLRAYGRMPGAEIALVLRPLEYRGLLVRVGKDGATQWEPAGGNIPADWPRVRARTRVNTLSTRAVVLDGPLADQSFSLHLEGAEDDRVLSVAVDVARKTCVPVSGDAPRRPDAEVTPVDAVRAIKRLQLAPGKAGSTTFRGQWSGALLCDDGAPVVELRRKLASYGWLRITSGPDGWTWTFERQEKWFSAEDTLHGASYATLVQAIDAGILGALGMVQVACRVRDTQRRHAHDSAWAAAHPLPEPRETTSPLERLRDRPEPSAAEVAPKQPKPKPGTARPAGPRTANAPIAAGPKPSEPKPKPARPTSRTAASAKPKPTPRPRPAPKPSPASTPAPAAPPPHEDAAMLAAFSEAVAAALTD